MRGMSGWNCKVLEILSNLEVYSMYLPVWFVAILVFIAWVFFAVVVIGSTFCAIFYIIRAARKMKADPTYNPLSELTNQEDDRA